MENNEDYLIRALAANGQVRAFGVTSRNLVEESRRIHNNSPIATAALGRLMSAALMMGDMMKEKNDLVTLQIHCDGPLKHVVVTSDFDGNVKGYVSNPDVILPPNNEGHLNVGMGMGKGTLTVIRDYGLKEPYVSQIDLHSGEIADDLTYYYAQSEQIPTSVGLGVLIDREDVKVKASGGFIVQLMPNTDKNVIDKLEDNIRKFPGVTSCLNNGNTPEEMLKIILDGFDVKFNERKPCRFHCSCSHQKGLDVLETLPLKTIREMIEEDKGAEVVCDFCLRKYDYTTEELMNIEEKIKNRS